MIHYVGFLDASVKLDGLTILFLPLERDLFYLCGLCVAYLLDYSLSNLQSSEKCTGPCNKHMIFTPVILSLGDTDFFVFGLT